MKINPKYLIATQALLFVCFLVTTLFFNRFAADDYHFIGALNTKTWQEVYSNLYFNWHGRWTSNFLLVFLLQFNKIPAFLFFYGIISFSFFITAIYSLSKSVNHYFSLSLPPLKRLLFSIVFITVLFFCTVSPEDSWFWFTSSVVYLWSITALFFALAIFLKTKKRKIDYILYILVLSYIGGANEPLTIISLIGLTYLVFKNHEKSFSLLGVIILLISFLVNYLSNGTTFRDEITPSLGLLDLMLYTGYGSFKFIFFSFQKTFIPALFFSLPFYNLGQKSNYTPSYKFIPLQQLFISSLAIGFFVFVNQLMVTYALGGLGPDRSFITSSVFIAFVIIRFVFLLGNKHQASLKKIKYLLILNIIILLGFNISFFKIHSNYSNSFDKRLSTIKRKSKIDKTIILDKLYFSGYIKSAEITTNPKHFLNKHLQEGLNIDNKLILKE